MIDIELIKKYSESDMRNDKLKEMFIEHIKKHILFTILKINESILNNPLILKKYLKNRKYKIFATIRDYGYGDRIYRMVTKDFKIIITQLNKEIFSKEFNFEKDAGIIDLF